jgi:predicted PurR-regulated permease PerM
METALSYSPSRMNMLTFALMVGALLMTLHLHLLPALLGGLLVYQFAEFGSRLLHQNTGVIPDIGKLILLGVITLAVVAGFVALVSALINFVSGGQENLIALLQRMADVLDTARAQLPAWAQQYIPSNVSEWQVAGANWLRENARNLGSWGGDVGKLLIHLIFGMVIGGLAAMHKPSQGTGAPLVAAIKSSALHLDHAFTSVVFSQVRISAINTALTGAFLVFVMPALGMELPMTKAMIAVTFIAGLLPIIGNLISNTVITLIALSVSPVAAVTALGYLIVVHKLEYFLNAHIIGHNIKSRVWEVLLAMLVMESAFGIAGLIAAPIYYAYLKEELRARALI